MSPHAEEPLSLSQAAEFLLQECRMVLPGVQALLGFQLIVIFNPGFDQKLGVASRNLHLLAIALVALAVIFVMAPAAYHRQTGVHKVSPGFLRLASRFLLLSMAPLALGICIDVGLIARVILQSPLGAVLAVLLFAIFVSVWFVLPRSRRLRRLAER